MRHEIEQRLHKAERQLRVFERCYHGDTKFYSDQIAYVMALRERLNTLIDFSIEGDS